MEAGLNRGGAGGKEAKRRRIVVAWGDGVDMVALHRRSKYGYRDGKFRERIRGRSAIASQPVQELGGLVVISLFEMGTRSFEMVFVDDGMIMIVIRIARMEVRLRSVAEGDQQCQGHHEMEDWTHFEYQYGMVFRGVRLLI